MNNIRRDYSTQEYTWNTTAAAEAMEALAARGGAPWISAEQALEAAAEIRRGPRTIVETHLACLGVANGQDPAAHRIVKLFRQEQATQDQGMRASRFISELLEFLSMSAMPDSGDPPMVEVGRIMRSYLDWAAARTASPKQWSKRMVFLRQFFRWLYERGLLPFSFIPRYSLRLSEEYVREQVRLQHVRDEAVPSRDDMRAILDVVAREGRVSLYATLRLMWHLGLRRSEAVRIRRDSFSLRKDGRWVYARYGKAERMTGRAKLYAIPDTLAQDVKRAFEKVDGWEVPECPLLYLEQVVVTRYSKSPRGLVFQRMKPEELTLLIQEYSKLAIGRKIGSHDIRRGRATQMMKDGRPIEMICRNLNMSQSVLMRHYDRSKPSLADDILTSSDFEIEHAANRIEIPPPGAVPAPALKAWGEHRTPEPSDQAVERDRGVGSWRI